MTCRSFKHFIKWVNYYDDISYMEEKREKIVRMFMKVANKFGFFFSQLNFQLNI